MKKILLLSLIGVGNVAVAQRSDSTAADATKIVSIPVEQNSTSKNNDGYKAGLGKFTTELNVNLFQGNLSFNNALQQIKVRYFTKDNFAYRLALNFNSNSTSSGNSTVYGTTPSSSSDDRSTTTIGVGLGFEKHFTGTSRLSPYIGAEISLVNKSTSETVKSTNNGSTNQTDLDGAWQNITYTNNGFITGFSENAYFRYGLNLVTGFDFYVVKKMYIGYEFTFQFYHVNYKDINITYTPANNYTNSPTYTASQTFVGPNIINGIRIGYVF